MDCTSNKFHKALRFVTKVFHQNGLALRYASDELKRDQEVVLAAVRDDKNALRFASEELQANQKLFPGPKRRRLY